MMKIYSRGEQTFDKELLRNYYECLYISLSSDVQEALLTAKVKELAEFSVSAEKDIYSIR